MRTSILMLIACSVLAGCANHDRIVKSVDDYKAEAEAAVVAYDVQTTKALVGAAAVIFVDVREGDEIARHGKIAGAVHVPRGILEFTIDPNSSLHMGIFRSGKKVIFYCESDGRSLLAARLAMDMGVRDPVYFQGGYRARVAADGVTTQ